MWNKLFLFVKINVRKKPKGQSRMDNSETLATLDTQDTRRRQKQSINKQTKEKDTPSKTNTKCIRTPVIAYSNICI